MTKEPTFYSDLCDFPGFNDTRGEDIDFNTLCKMVGVLQNYSSFRIIFLAEFTTLESANGSNFINLTKYELDKSQLTKFQLILINFYLFL